MTAFLSRILVADDDEAFRSTVVRMLEAAGFEVLAASGFGTSLQVLDTSGPVDLLLADLRFAPGTPHGFSMARVIQRRYPQMKIVFMTGGDAQGFALNQPDDVILQKPFQSRELVETLKGVLHRDAS